MNIKQKIWFGISLNLIFTIIFNWYFLSSEYWKLFDVDAFFRYGNLLLGLSLASFVIYIVASFVSFSLENNTNSIYKEFLVNIVLYVINFHILFTTWYLFLIFTIVSGVWMWYLFDNSYDIFALEHIKLIKNNIIEKYNTAMEIFD